MFLWMIWYGCSGGGENPEDTAIPRFDIPEGLFEITSYLLNESGCEEPGEDRVLELTEPYMFFLSVTLMEQEYVTAYSCASEDNCAEKQDAIDSNEPFSMALTYTFSENEGEDRMRGVTQTTGWSMGDGTCSEPERRELLLTSSAETLTIRNAITTGEDYLADEEGYCTSDAAAIACQDMPCTQLETVILRPI